MDTYTDPLAQKRGKGGIAHIRTDSNSWCLCLVNDATRRNHQAWFSLSTLGGANPSLGWPQTRRWAISGLLSVSTPLDHFSSPLSPRSFSVLFFNHPSLVPVSVYLTLSRSAATLETRCFHIPRGRELHCRSSSTGDLADPGIRSKPRFVGFFMAS